MVFNGVILSFEIGAEESLGRLVKELGFTSPTKTDSGMTTNKVDYQNASKVEVERIGNDVLVTLYLEDPKKAAKAVNEVLADLNTVGLLEK